MGTDTDTDPGEENLVYAVRRGEIPEGELVHLGRLAVTGVSRSGLHCQHPSGGPYSGIFVYLTSPRERVEAEIGDEIQCTGRVREHSDPYSAGSVTLVDAMVLGGFAEVTERGAGEVAPASVSQGEIADVDLGEPWENVLVKIEDATVADAALPDGEWRLEGGAVVDDRLFAWDGGFVGAGAQFSAISGVLWYSRDEHKLEPRRASDLEGYAAPPFDLETVYRVQRGEVEEGTAVRVEGVRVTGVAPDGVFVQETGGGEESGVFVALHPGGGAEAGVAEGDEVTVWGSYEEWDDHSVIDARTGLVELTTAAAGALEAALVSTSQLGVPASAASWEAVLVRVEDVTVVDPSAGYGEWLVDDGVRVGDLIFAFDGGLLEVDASFESITGLVWPSHGETAVEPRGAADFVGFQPGPPQGADRLAPGDLVVSEIMANPSACPDLECEWIEVVNTTAAEIDLDRLRIELRSEAGSLLSETTLSGETLVPAGGYAVLAASDGSGYGWSYPWTPDGAYTGLNLSNTRDGVLVVGNRDGAVDSTAAYDSDLDPGVAWQLSPTAMDASANDDAANWCGATSTIGTTEDLGTPGTVNDGC